jgi:hypothetical protein
MNAKQFNGRTLYEGRELAGRDRLRMVLEDARIPLDIDRTLLPASAKHAEQVLVVLCDYLRKNKLSAAGQWFS